MNNKFSVVTVSMLLCSQIFNNNTFLGRQQGNHFEKLSTEKISGWGTKDSLTVFSGFKIH